jgi:WD40 repeat protein
VALPDGRTLLATGSTDRTVRLWDPTTGPPLTGHTSGVRSVTAAALSDGRTLLASGSADRTMIVWAFMPNRALDS